MQEEEEEEEGVCGTYPLELKLTSHVAAPPVAGGVCLLAGRPGLPIRPEVHHARLEEKHPGLSPTGPGGR